MKLLPFVRIFFNADGVPGGTDAPVAEPHASTADAIASELEDFTPPDLNALGDTPKPGEKPPTEPKKEEKPPEPKKPEEPKQPDKKTTEPPAKQLRDELERTRKERDDFKAKFENHPKVKELEASIAERTKELESLKAEAEKTRKELDIRDPLASSKLRDHQQKFDQEFTRSIEFVPEIEGNYQQLVGEFANLPRNDREQYRTALAEFEQKVEEAVGGRKFAAAMDLIRKGHDFVQEHNSLRKEVTENASKIAYEARSTEWQKYDGEVSSILQGALEVPEDLEDSDPYHPALFLKRTLAEVPEEKQKETLSKIDTYLRRVFAGPKPKTEADFMGLSPKEIQERLAAEGAAHSKAKQEAVRIMKNGMLALTLMRPFLADYAKLRERVAKEAEEIPPNPNGGGDTPAAESDDLSTYTPPAISL